MQGLLERLGLTALPGQESAEPPPDSLPRLPSSPGKRALHTAPRPLRRPGYFWCLAALGLVAPGGTPLPLMRQLHPSNALRGYDSGERSPFCQPPLSCSRSASPFKLHSRVAGGARGGKSPPEPLLLIKWLEGGHNELARLGLGLVFILWECPLARPPRGSWGHLCVFPRSPGIRGLQLFFLVSSSIWLANLKGQGLFFFWLTRVSLALGHGPEHVRCSVNTSWLHEGSRKLPPALGCLVKHAWALESQAWIQISVPLFFFF